MLHVHWCCCMDPKQITYRPIAWLYHGVCNVDVLTRACQLTHDTVRWHVFECDSICGAEHGYTHGKKKHATIWCPAHVLCVEIVGTTLKYCNTRVHPCQFGMHSTLLCTWLAYHASPHQSPVCRCVSVNAGLCAYYSHIRMILAGTSVQQIALYSKKQFQKSLDRRL